MVLVAGAVGLATAIAWTAAVARVGPRGEAVLSAGLLVAPLAVGLAVPAAGSRRTGIWPVAMLALSAVLALL